MNPVRASLDGLSFLSLFSAWAGALNPILTFLLTTASILWLSIQIYSWWNKK